VVTVATAESCTGGLVGHAITSVPGSSAYYIGGVISYADRLKVQMLGVPAATIERHGAVSAQVAVAMAEGLREELGCHLAVAVTGVAGPAGGSDPKPVGLTYVAVAGPEGHRVERHQWHGDRDANQAWSAAAALALLISVLETDPPKAAP
jgi:PncC family amidohydrolase